MAPEPENQSSTSAVADWLEAVDSALAIDAASSVLEWRAIAIVFRDARDGAGSAVLISHSTGSTMRTATGAVQGRTVNLGQIRY